jgi:hypothetical protein
VKLFFTIQIITKSLKTGFAVAGLALLSACASSSRVSQADFGLPIEEVDSASGSIVSWRALKTADRLYIAGRGKPHQLRRPMHVNVQLIGADGHVVAEETDDLVLPKHPRTSPVRHAQHSYVASFPLSEVRKAVKIRVVYHESDHGNS